MNANSKKFLFYFLFLVFINICWSQNIYQEQADKSHSKSFNIPIAVDSISFDSFKLKVTPINSDLNIHQIVLNNQLNGNTNFYKEDDTYVFEFYSKDLYKIKRKQKIIHISASTNQILNSSKLIELEHEFFNKGTKLKDLKVISLKSSVNNFVLFKNDGIVFGILLLCLGFVFYTESIKSGFWGKFYKIVPGLLMCYLLPAIFNSFGIISDEVSQTYYIASRYLLPASLVLLTISIDLKAIFNLGWRAIAMFFTGTIGIVIGGPLAILLISTFSPETVGGVGFDATWRGLATLAGSWIGGGANQAAMLEIYQFNPEKYGGMVLVDIVVANIWMAILLTGIGKKNRINKWLKADNTAILELQKKVQTFSEKITRNPTLTDIMIILTFAFVAVGIAHFTADNISSFLNSNFEAVSNPKSPWSSFGGKFFWLISIATLIGILLSFTKAKNFEGAGASKIGSVFIYILVATIGMKMDLGKIFENPGLILIGLVWMAIHAGLLIFVAKLIKAPYFFLAVGSQANVGGAASAPVVAAAFHPSLATVGALLAVFGYVVGTYGAMLCAELMRIASISG